MFLMRWYKGLSAVVRWNGQLGKAFSVGCGTRQGSILSPQLFNIFLDDLLKLLDKTKQGLLVGDDNYNAFAYADDVTIFSPTVPGLQVLIKTCVDYATKWKFKFGIKKTKCMIVGKHEFMDEPIWMLGSETIDNVNTMETLGVVFNNDCNNVNHVDVRIQKCYRSYYSLRNVGFAYPGVNSDVKTYLWNTICQPTLLYGCETLKLNDCHVKKLETTQGNILKQSLGLSKFSHSTDLLAALNITKVDPLVKQHTLSLWNRIFKVNSPIRKLCSHFYNTFLTSGSVIPGTLLSKVLRYGFSPIKCALQKIKPIPCISENGVADSLRVVLSSEGFRKPYSEEHLLAVLLTKSF